jgi:hypothetical protein
VSTTLAAAYLIVAAHKAAMEVGNVEVDVGKRARTRGRRRKAFTFSSRPWQIRLTSDLEMPLSAPKASTRVSTLRAGLQPVGEEAALA